MGEFQQALAAELTLWGQGLGRPAVGTVFFGGGTPSYLPEGAIGDILSAARNAFNVDPAAAEITIEANPGDLDIHACESLLRQGVNRLSIGVQSLNNESLRLLGRRHDASEAVAALQTARSAGFRNVNLDFMYGLPPPDPRAVEGHGIPPWRLVTRTHLALRSHPGGGYSDAPVGCGGQDSRTRP